MQYEVRGTDANGAFMTKYKASGNLLLEILSTKKPDESLTDALARRLQQPRHEVALVGAGQKKILQRTIKHTVARHCADPNSDQFQACARCWASILRKLFKERGRYCHVCGSVEGLSAHHIIPRSEWGTYDWPNLIPLCEACHDYVECHEKKPRTLDTVIRVGMERLTA